MHPVLRLDHRYHDLEDHDRGLVFDMATLDRRRMLKLLGLGGISAGLFTIVGCNPSAVSPSASGGRDRYPRLGSLRRRRIFCGCVVRANPGGDGRSVPGRRLERARRPLADRGRPEGHPVELRIVHDRRRRASRSRSASRSRTGPTARRSPVPRSTSWHCDRDGNYSLYSEAAANENYLRGVQAAGDDGIVTFDSIFPAAYPGRWPHIHFEVYPSLETATDEANKIATSQIALPKDASDAVYATAGYEQSVQVMRSLSLETDNVFADDGGVRQLGTVSGDVASGYSVSLTVPVNG